MQSVPEWPRNTHCTWGFEAVRRCGCLTLELSDERALTTQAKPFDAPSKGVIDGAR